MLKIGLTGGIGSGKTVVTDIFNQLGIDVFNADNEAKKLINSSENIIKKLTERYGKDIYSEKQIINKKKLADIIFNNKKELNFVNSVIHPEVFKSFNSFIDNKKSSKYIIHEAAILFESGAHKLMDKIIVVDAPVEIRINRITNRDNISRKKVMERINNQAKPKELKSKADFIIINDGKKELIPQVLKIDKKLKIYG